MKTTLNSLEGFLRYLIGLLLGITLVSVATLTESYFSLLLLIPIVITGWLILKEWL